jgi:aminoglycoside phosphotransferase (APT) family kinase protein
MIRPVEFTTREDMAERLQRLLCRRLSTNDVEVTEVQPLTGGYGSVIARFEAAIDARTSRLVLRANLPPDRVPVVTDRAREWDLVSALSAADGFPIPKAWFFDSDGPELGSPAMIVDFIDGETLQMRADRSADAEHPALADHLCDLAATLVATDLKILPATVERPRSWSDYVASHIDEWRMAASEHVEPDPFLGYMASWLEHNVPPEAPLALVHGDLQAPNVMIDGEERWLLIDWEFGHIGDPREDMGSLQFNELARPPGLFTLDPLRFCERYRDRTGLGVDVINPATIAYFSILPFARTLRSVLRQVRGLLDGTNHSFVSAYAVGVLATLHEHWLAAVKGIEAMQAAPGLVRR